MEKLVIFPKTMAQGSINIPGSKSLSNRILLLSALAKGETKIRNLLHSDDTKHMIEALELLGIDCQKDAGILTVCGQGGAFATGGENIELYLGNAGTAMRPLAAALCLGNGAYTLTGEPRMQERPIKDLVDAILPLGADITYLKNSGFPPLKIKASGLKGGKTSVAGNISSQYTTALLMAGPLMQNGLELAISGEVVSQPYIDLTIALMEQFGCHVAFDSMTYRVQPTPLQSPGDILVEGDASSASYFLAAAAISGGKVRVTGVGRLSTQGDIGFVHVLEKLGAKVSLGDSWVEVQGTKQLSGIDIDMNEMPDVAMTLAMLGLFSSTPIRITNIYNWRLKETDRLSAMATELKKLGAEVEEGRDYISVFKKAPLKAAQIATYNDHRMAMCFSLAAFAGIEVTIEDPKCTAKTFPDYFDKFAEITS